MSSAMNGKSNSDEKHSDGIRNGIQQIDNVPGGEKKTLPAEPTPPEEDITMGACTSVPRTPSRKSTPTKNPLETPNKQTKITDHFSTTSSSNKTEAKKPKLTNTSKATTFSDDTDDHMSDENEFGSSSRSYMNRTPSHLDFPDSDDEDGAGGSTWTKRDIEDYRTGYPHLKSNSKIKTNLKFYTNQTPSYPDGDYIDSIHQNWFGNYKKLEYHHGFIQWLFPLQEAGLNWSADPLQKHEIDEMKNNPEVMKRLLKSYRLMLDFYGFELVDEDTGALRRSKNNPKERLRNLNTSSHNYLRITRILKCLGEFDYEYLKKPFLVAILNEAIVQRSIPNCVRSCRDYWIETLRDSEERRQVRDYARKLVQYQEKKILRPSPPPPSKRKITPSPKTRRTGSDDT